MDTLATAGNDKRVELKDRLQETRVIRFYRLLASKLLSHNTKIRVFRGIIYDYVIILY